MTIQSPTKGNLRLASATTKLTPWLPRDHKLTPWSPRNIHTSMSRTGRLDSYRPRSSCASTTPTACIVCSMTVTSETSAGHCVLDQPHEAGYANMSTHGIVREDHTFTLKLVAKYTSVQNAVSRNSSRSTTCTILGSTPIVHSQCKNF